MEGSSVLEVYAITPTNTQMQSTAICISSMQHLTTIAQLSFGVFGYPYPIYKAATISPATTAARPNSTLPAAPVASGRPEEPVAVPAVGLGPPEATGTVPFPFPCPLEPVG
ncbi:hypothetical protein IG631_19326 [Alternaria alternata]|nr:hypothetical protein IG631_19326 [Alternaria alternata]